MTSDEFRAALGREPSATDQPPGVYTDKRIGVTPLAARKGDPVRGVRIVYDAPYWFCFVNNELAPGSGVHDPMEIPFVLWNAPFWPTTEATHTEVVDFYYVAIMEEETQHAEL